MKQAAALFLSLAISFQTISPAAAARSLSERAVDAARLNSRAGASAADDFTLDLSSTFSDQDAARFAAMGPIEMAAVPSERAPLRAVERLKALRDSGVDLTGASDDRVIAARIKALVRKGEVGPALGRAAALSDSILASGGAPGGARTLGHFFENSAPVTSKDIEAVTGSLPFRFWNTLARLAPSKTLKKRLQDRAESAFGTVDPSVYELKSTQVGWVPDVEKLKLPETLPEDAHPIAGQARALAGIEFGLRMPDNNHHLFVTGKQQSGRLDAVKHELEKIAPKEKTPFDRVFATGLRDPDDPELLDLPADSARRFEKLFDEVIPRAKIVLEGRLKSIKGWEKKRAAAEAMFLDEVKPLMTLIVDGFIDMDPKEREAFNAWHKRHEARDKEWKERKRVGRYGLARPTLETQDRSEQMGLVLTLDGKAYAGLDGELLDKDAAARVEAGKFGPEERSELEAAIAEAKRKAKSLEKTMERERAALEAEDLDDLKKVRVAAIERLPPELQRTLSYLTDFAKTAGAMWAYFLPGADSDPIDRFHVHVLSAREETEAPQTDGSPVVYVGKDAIHEEVFGWFKHNKREVTTEAGVKKAVRIPGDMEIKTGLFHHANEGHIVFDAWHVAMTPGLFDDILETLETGMAPMREAVSLLSEGGAVLRAPWKGQVTFIGDSWLLEAMRDLYPEFAKHFQSVAQFDRRMDINDEHVRGFLNFLKRQYDEHKGKGPGEELLYPEPGAVKVFLMRLARDVESNRELSANWGQVIDLWREAGLVARQAGRDKIGEADVRAALKAKLYREGLSRERYTELYGQDIMHLQIHGERVGETNALTVNSGLQTFGLPTRTTVTMSFTGETGVKDSDRSVGWTGSSFDAGVENVNSLVSSLFLYDNKGRPQEFPAVLHAKKEQLYEGIDGDSSTSTKIYAALSAISGIAIKMTRAMTGSASQAGDIQPIGGVNEKIEGFFDVLRMRLALEGKELDGTHGVIIPASNVQDLMLDGDVVRAIEEGKFHIWAVRTVGQGLAVLTGMPLLRILYRGNLALAQMIKVKSKKD